MNKKTKHTGNSFFESQVMFICDVESLQIVDANEAAVEQLGYSKEKLKEKKISDLGEVIQKHPEGNGQHEGRIPADYLDSHTVWKLLDRTGSEHTVHYTSHLIQHNGRLAKLMVAHDVAESNPSEIQLKKTVERFRILGETSLIGLYIVKDMEFQYVSPRFCEILGYREEELTNGIGPLDLIHDEDKEAVTKLHEYWTEKKMDSFETHFKVVSKKGNVVHLHAYGSRVKLTSEKSAVIGVVVNETEHQDAIENFKMSLESYKTLFDSIADAIYIHDNKGRFLEVNDGASAMYGYEKSEMVGKSPEFLAAPGKVNLEETFEYFDRALEGETIRFEWWGRRKNGEIFPKEVQLNPGFYFGEKVVIAIARDVSEQYYRQEKIKENEEMLRQLFMNSPIGIALLDEHQEVKMINKGFEEIFGYKQEDIVGLDIDKVIVPEGKEEEAQALTLSDEVFEVSTRRLRKDGEVIDVLIYGVPVDVEGKTIAIYGIYVDITDRKQAEEKVKRSLKEKEVLLAEIHHRVKNNLAVITGLLELQSYNTENEDAIKVLKDSQSRINSMALIHEKLYQSKNLSQIQFDVYINELVREITMSHISKSKPVEFRIEADPIPLTITQAIPCGLLLNEVVTNALKHAFAGRENGNVEISFKRNGDKLSFCIADNGIGLPEDFLLDRTQSLGMKLIHTLAKQLEAEMSITSEGGTCFDLSFKHDDLIVDQE